MTNTHTSRLAGQVLLVTGGASGLGAALVQRFVDEGARVAVLDRSEQSLTALRERHGDGLEYVHGDVRSLEDNKRAVARCVERFGALDCAVGNAGIWDYSVSLLDLPEGQINAAFDELFQVNVLGYLLLAKAAMRALVASRGSLLFTVSNAGFLTNGGGPLYTATKHAVVGLVRQLAFELAPYVRVNGVAPGAINTSLRGAAALGQQDRRFPGDRIEAAAAASVPIGRLPTPAEYAGAWVFLASRQDHVPATGTVLNHDGGFAIRGFGANVRGGDDLAERMGLEPL